MTGSRTRQSERGENDRTLFDRRQQRPDDHGDLARRPERHPAENENGSVTPPRPRDRLCRHDAKASLIRCDVSASSLHRSQSWRCAAKRSERRSASPPSRKRSSHRPTTPARHPGVGGHRAVIRETHALHTHRAPSPRLPPGSLTIKSLCSCTAIAEICNRNRPCGLSSSSVRSAS